MKKLFYSLLLFVLIVTFSFSTLATNTTTKSVGTTTLDLVEDTVCTINVDDIAKFEKKITKFDKTNRSATLTLSLTNTKKSETTTKPVEIFLVIDNSSSMRDNKVGDVTREQIVINSANKLIDKLFETNKNAKIGVVSFSSLDNLKGETEGTIDDAKLLLELSNSKTAIKDIIKSIPTTNAGPHTNIEAGITIASEKYSTNNDTNRYMILLTDGLPNNDLNHNFVSYGGEVSARTKAKLKDIESKGIKIISTMIGLDETKTVTISDGITTTYKALAKDIFGVEGSYTTSHYYNIPSTKEEIETTIVDQIYRDIIIKKDNTLKNFKIKDYFPQEIIDNFKFEYVTDPNIGKVTAKVDTKDNSITWTIPELKEGQTAKVSYKLTLKENYNKEIINKVLPTNAKVDITGEDNNGKKYEKSSKDSPKVKVLYKDNTVADKVIPQTGENSTIIFVIVGTFSLVAIASFIYLKRNNILGE